MLLKIGINNPPHRQRNVLDCTGAYLVSKFVRRLDQSHLALCEAARFVSVPHNTVVIQDKDANFLAFIAHEHIWSIWEHTLLHASRLIHLHYMQVLEVSLDETLRESADDAGFERVICGGTRLCILHLSHLMLLHSAAEGLVCEGFSPDCAQFSHLRVLEVAVGVIDLFEFVKLKLVSYHIEAHIIQSVAKRLDMLQVGWHRLFADNIYNSWRCQTLQQLDTLQE